MATHAPTVPRHDGQVFALWCTDGPDAQRLRDEHLEGHLLHVEKHHDRYIVAGPLRPTDQPELDGSFFLILADSEEDAMAVVKDDPYFTSGMYADMKIRAFTPAVGKYIGGVTWEDTESVRQFATRARAADPS
jgi:hypothetical protein